jgi:3-hydroxybutyryl-CoA dehydratase
MMRGRYWEEFEAGQSFLTAGRTVESGDVNLFAGLSGDFNPLHINAEHSKTNAFGSRVAHGILILAISSGQLNQLGIFEGTTLAILAMDNVRWSNPVRFGDTVVSHPSVTETRPSTKPDRGIVNMNIKVINQRDELVLQYDQALLMLRKAQMSP